jgi:hypothetical protein
VPVSGPPSGAGAVKKGVELQLGARERRPEAGRSRARRLSARRLRLVANDDHASCVPSSDLFDLGLQHRGDRAGHEA